MKRKDLITSTTESTEDYVWNDIDEDKRKWFRPSDVTVGTDGAIYIADWYDPVVGGHQMMDSIGYGRIYRITPRGKALQSPEIDLTTAEGQIMALLNPAINVRNLGFEKLRSRGEAVFEEVNELLQSPNPYHRARAIWLLPELGTKGKSAVINILKNEADPRMRVVAYRALKNDSESLLDYSAIAVSDPSADVRREVAISLRDIQWDKSGVLIKELYQDYDGVDAWYLEALGIAIDDKAGDAYAALLVNQGRNPGEWSEAFANLVWRIRPVAAISALKQRALANDIPEAFKRKAIDALAFTNHENAVAAMLELADAGGNEFVQNLAKRWVDFRRTNDWFTLWDWQSETGQSFGIPKELAANHNTLLDPNKNMVNRIEAGKQLAYGLVGGRLLIYLASEKKLPTEIVNGVSKTIFEKSLSGNPNLGWPVF